MRALFTCTLFLSAALLFLVQPLVARLVLPLLGGTPAVWNTCMVFFQAVLLVGYAYAHAGPAWLGVRRHSALHLGVMLLPFLVLPIAIPNNWVAPDNNRPIAWLLGLLLIAVGLPFFAVSTGGPLLQRWFAATDDPAARDPYFLYAASNLGSLLALLAYPLLLEPTLRLADQGRTWAWGYGALVLATATCAAALWRRPGRIGQVISQGERFAPPRAISGRQRLRWVALAFVPSSLMLSVTTYLTTDIAAVPLLWVLPLSLYLFTFVVAFSRRPPPLAMFSRWMPLVVLIAVVVMLTEATEPLVVIVFIHLLVLFWIGVVCHGAVAAERPAAARLTEFYLWLSAGGALGGLFNALVAPLVFNSITEYPMVLVLACLVRPGWGDGATRADIFYPSCLGLGTVLLILAGRYFGLREGPLAVGAAFGVPLVICYLFSPRPVQFGLGVGAILMAATLYEGVAGRVQYRTRSFFGAHRVTLDATGQYRSLWHGNTLHGMQSLDKNREREPLTYYHRTGPAGRLLEALRGDSRLRRVGLVGLGAGALACYANADQHWTFFEIDPAVERIAREQFTYWNACPADVDLVLGDARFKLGECDERFGLLVIDAFSSDAIPVHLLTREALQVYRDHLTNDGLIAFNISNRYLDLRPVLAALAADAGMICLAREDLSVSQSERRAGKSPSRWVVLANSPEAARKIRAKGAWEEVRADANAPLWTDDFSNLLGVISWR